MGAWLALVALEHTLQTISPPLRGSRLRQTTGQILSVDGGLHEAFLH